MRHQVHSARIGASVADVPDNSQVISADVTGRTVDPLAKVEQHVDAVTIARRLECSPDFIRDEMTRGRLPYLRIGRKRVVPISAVEAYVAERAVGNHPARATAIVVGFPPAKRRTA